MVDAYFDCFSGICGDMVLGALVNLGMSTNYLKKELGKLDISGYEIEARKIEKSHIVATDVYVNVKEEQKPRSFKDINAVIDDSDLDTYVKNLSKKIFLRLAKAESKVHNVRIEDVHFHEIGAVDSIIDIVGSAIGLKKLKIERVYSSYLPVGKGFVRCSHGLLPIPAPATVELLKNIPIYQVDANYELVTPTGAAIISTIASYFGNMPLMRIKKIGYGAGKINRDRPNLLRVYLGKIEEER